MKILMIILLSLCATVVEAVPLVNDRTGNATAEDSLTMLFWATDSLGGIAATDSLFILVTGPDGAGTFAETTTVADGRVENLALGAVGLYTWREEVAALTNGGPPGLYRLVLLARASSPPHRLTTHATAFQLVGVTLSEQLALIGSGQGAFSRTLLVVDTASSNGLPGVSLTVTDLTQAAVVAQGWTDPTGKLDVNLDAGSLLVVATCPGYTFAAYDTIEVAGGGFDTVAATRWYPEAPASLLKCRVWGNVYGFDGAPEVGAEVSAFLPGGVVRLNGVIISPFEVTTTTDAAGFFQIDLVPSELLEPPDAEYDISIRRSDGAILRRHITVPNEGLWRLTW